jgi:hypothetical protein
MAYLSANLWSVTLVIGTSPRVGVDGVAASYSLLVMVVLVLVVVVWVVVVVILSSSLLRLISPTLHRPGFSCALLASRRRTTPWRTVAGTILVGIGRPVPASLVLVADIPFLALGRLFGRLDPLDGK